MIPGLATLISALATLFGSSMPRVFDLFEKKMNFSQELKIRTMEAEFRKSEYAQQLELAKANITGKLEEAWYEGVKAEVAANAQSYIAALQAAEKPTGISWIDTINSSLRPFFFLTTMILFFIVIMQYVIMSPAALEMQAAMQFWVAVEGVTGWMVGRATASALRQPPPRLT